jgi:hypothetical protein
MPAIEASTLDFNIDNSSGRRVCCGCFLLKERSELMTCGVCKVFMYCNKDCQRVGWRDFSHKKTCTASAPAYIVSLPRDLDDPADLDKPYSFIHIAPRGISDKLSYPDKASYLACSSGFDEDEVVVKLRDGKDKAAMSARFSWPSGTPGKNAVPGYCLEWDKTALYCFTDDNFLNEPELLSSKGQINPVASYVLMISSDSAKAVRGSAVIFCLDEDEKLVKITRRDVLSIAKLNQSSEVPQRVRFENMRRAAILEGLRKQNTQFVNLNED